MTFVLILLVFLLMYNTPVFMQFLIKFLKFKLSENEFKPKIIYKSI